MKCQWCGKEYPHKKGRFCGYCQRPNGPRPDVKKIKPPFELPRGLKERTGGLREIYGHENGCDCAVCDDIALRESLCNIADGEFNKLLDDNARLIETVERYRIALEIIVNIGSNDPAFRFVNVANEALGFARKNL